MTTGRCVHTNLSPAEAADRLAIRELFDAFAKIDGRWCFAERKLIVDWSETQTLSS
jgi:hypothetical protein